MRRIPRRQLIIAGVALALYLAAALAMTWPMITDPANRVFGPFVDSAGAIADLNSWAEHGFALFGTRWVDWLGAPIGYPSSDILNITAVLLVGPALLITQLMGGTIAYNVIIILGLVVPALVTYVAVRWIGTGALPAFWAGLVTLVLPFHVEVSADWFSVGQIATLPIALVGVAWWGERPSFRRAALLLAVLLIAFFTNAYVGFICLVMMVCALLGWLVMPGRPLSWPNRIRHLGTAAAALVVALLPVTILGLDARSQVAGRGTADLYNYSVDFWRYLTPSSRSPLYADVLGGPVGLSSEYFTLFMGFLTIALALTGLVAPRAWGALRSTRTAPVLTGAAIITVVAVLLAHSRPFEVLGFSITSPGEILYRALPTFRALDRLGMAVGVALAIAGAIGLFRLMHRIGDPRWAAMAGVAAIIVSGAELAVRPQEQSPPLDIPAWADAVRDIDPPTPIVVFPLDNPDATQGFRLRYVQSKIDVPFLNGAPPGTVPGRFLASLPPVTDARAISALYALGVDFIVQRDAMRPPRTKLVRRTADGTIYRITGSRPAAVAYYTEGYPLETLPNGQRTRWIGAASALEVRANRPACLRVSLSASSYGPERTVTLRTPGRKTRKRVGSGATALAFILPVDAGGQRIAIGAEPGPTTIPGDGRIVSINVTEPVVQELPASACKG